MNTSPTSTTQPTPSGHGYATTSLIFGILSLLFAIIPYFGLSLGVIALIFAVIAKRKQTRATAGLITGIIGIVLGIIGTLFVTWLITGSNLFDTTRSDAVQAQLSEKKDFSSQETVHIGAIDLKITKVNLQYAPTAEELKKTAPRYIKPESSTVFGKKQTSSSALASNAEYYDSKLTDDNDTYVLVEGELTKNGKESVGSPSDLSQLELNYYAPYHYAITYPNDQELYSSTEPTTLRYVFRIKKDSPSLTLYYRTTVYLESSPIVGTEGAPYENLVYTIKI